MLSAELRKLLIAQIGNELAAHQLYLAISIYFERQSLERWGKLFRHQSVDEAQHAQRIIDFLVDSDVDFDLPALKATSTRFESAAAAARRALDSERTVAGQFDRAAAVAKSADDHRGFQFLQWFIAEQVEEEASSSASSTSSKAGSTCSMLKPSSMRMSSEAEMRAATIGEPTRIDGPVHLADYDPGWPAAYEREAARVRDTLGDRVRRLEHVGSTSVPGLATKPIIDMLLVVDDSADEDAYVGPMEASGYVLRIREPDWNEHRMFIREPPRIQIHTFSVGCPEIERMIAFRDRLRTHGDDRLLYERAKRELASREWAYVQHYADAKGDVVEAIIARSEQDRAALTSSAPVDTVRSRT